VCDHPGEKGPLTSAAAQTICYERSKNANAFSICANEYRTFWRRFQAIY